MTDHIDKFKLHLSRQGYTSKKPIIADDRFHRLFYDMEKVSSARYSLKVTADGSYIAYFGSERDPKGFRGWSSFNKAIDNETAQEREQRKTKYRAEKREQERKLNIMYQRLSKRLTKAYQALPLAPSGHPYLKRKGIKAHPSIRHRVKGNQLIIPIRQADGTLTSLQHIYPNGFKRFFKGGKVKGGYHTLHHKGISLDRIAICEGLATGMSIYECADIPVVLAFNCHKIKETAQTLATRYPESQIILAADNDHERADANGEIDNIGVRMAEQAAVSIGGAFVAIPVPSDTIISDYPKFDFNDAYLTMGADYVRSIIGKGGLSIDLPDHSLGCLQPPLPSYDDITDIQIPDSELPPLSVYEKDVSANVSLYTAGSNPNKDIDWKEKLKYHPKHGGLEPKYINNVVLYLRNHDIIGNLFCFDDFAKEKIVYQCPPWESTDNFKPRQFKDDDVMQLALYLERIGLTPDLGTLKKLTHMVIQENKRNPAQEYFSRLVWDGKPRLNTWLKRYAGATDNPDYLASIGRKWMTAIVTRVFRAGAKFDSVLILEGDQNLGKSTLLRELATINNKPYFDDTITVSSLGSKDTILKQQGVLIVELAELTGLSKKGDDELKQYIALPWDKLIKKYESEPTIYYRQFVFSATINPMGGYLKDMTGNRRWWPCKVTNIDMDALKADKEQLWAEAVELYHNGEKLYLEGEDFKLATEQQELRMAEHPWIGILSEYLNGVPKIAVRDVYDYLGFSDKSKLDQARGDLIMQIMMSLGYDKKPAHLNGKTTLSFVKAES